MLLLRKRCRNVDPLENIRLLGESLFTYVVAYFSDGLPFGTNQTTLLNQGIQA